MSKIAWMDWGDTAFTRAQQEDKPLLLDLDATWCHWCHVMESTTYSDNEVVQLLNDHFIPIRVDPDRRPDINDRYNQGGWPTTAIVAPSGEVLYGATYLPADQMKALLRNVVNLWQNRRDEVREAVASFKRRVAEDQAAAAQPSNYVPEYVLDVVIERSKEQFDFAYGGFASASSGFAPKFPFPEMVEVCLLHHATSGSQETQDMARKTLNGMSSGIEDTEEGGFFRYAVERSWGQPHYEKMLQTNAALLKLYLRAWQILGDQGYRQSATGIISWALKVMARPGGGFWGSQDADGEDAYYGLSLSERATLPMPLVDKTIFCDWSAEMSRAFLEASLLLGDQDTLNQALSTLDYLLSECRQPGGPMFHYIANGKAQLPGLLNDQSHTILALSKAYQLSANRHYLLAATELADFMLAKLYVEQEGIFLDVPPEIEPSGIELRRQRDIIHNSIAAEALLEMHYLTGEERYREAAGKALKAFAHEYAEFGPFSAPYALAGWHYHRPISKLIVIGKASDFSARWLLVQALAAGYPVSVAQLLDPERNREQIDRLGLPIHERPTAFLCLKDSCQAVEDPEQLADLVRKNIFNPQGAAVSVGRTG